MNHNKITLYIYISIIGFLFIQCQPPAPKVEEEVLKDPIETYSVEKPDSLHGIVIVSRDKNNPFEVRKKINEYEIPEKTFEAKRKKFYDLLNNLELLFSIEEPNIYNVVDSLNYLAAYYLQNLLEDPKSVYSPLKHRMLYNVSSSDKRLRVFGWNENTGMLFKTHINVYQYKTQGGQLKACMNDDINSDYEFNFSHGKIKSLYKLPTKGENDLYLVLFSGSDCSTCIFKGATIIEMKGDTLNFDYPAFEDGLSYFIVDYTDGDKIDLTYNSKLQTLNCNHIRMSKVPRDTIVQHLEFNGVYFQE